MQKEQLAFTFPPDKGDTAQRDVIVELIFIWLISIGVFAGVAALIVASIKFLT